MHGIIKGGKFIRTDTQPGSAAQPARWTSPVVTTYTELGCRVRTYAALTDGVVIQHVELSCPVIKS